MGSQVIDKQFQSESTLKLQCLPLPCTAHLHTRLVCRHDIDHVIKDEHIES